MYQHLISAVLDRIGGNVCYMGYGYCLTGLEYMLVSRKGHFRITSDIYPIIAEAHNTSVSNVERNIRTMVDACWYDGDRELIQRICHRKHKPSNGAFLAGLYSHLARQLHLMDKPACRAAAAAEKSGKGSGDF